MAGREVIPHLRHDIVGLLYTIKGMAGSHLAQAEEGRFVDLHARLDHAEQSLKNAYARADCALEVTQRLGRVLGAREKSAKMRSSGGADFQKAWFRIEAILTKEFCLSGIEILLHVPVDFPPVPCDPSHFEEILYQLARNALQSMAGAGKLRLSARQGCSAAGRPVCLVTVEDTGAGIKREHLPRIFTPFFTTKPPGKGNGLGLYLTKLLVERNYGRITVSSSVGLGTVFVIEFPLRADTT